MDIFVEISNTKQTNKQWNPNLEEFQQFFYGDVTFDVETIPEAELHVIVLRVGTIKR